MEKSNLILFSNVFPWDGRFSRNERAFLAEISDVEALRRLARLEELHEVVLTSRQRALIKWSTPCSRLSRGDSPFGWLKDGRKERRICLCRMRNCPYYTECLGDEDMSQELQRVREWQAVDAEAQKEFADLWRKREVQWPQITNGKDAAKVFAMPDEMECVRPGGEKGRPEIMSAYPDDEKFIPLFETTLIHEVS